MNENILTQEKLKKYLHYDSETGTFTRKVAMANNRHKAGEIAGYLHNTGYIRIRVETNKYLAHRLAWLYVYGEFPVLQIDHINRIRHDNKIKNLRLATSSENLRNTKIYSSNKTGINGVRKRKNENKWIAHIGHNNKRIYIGKYKDLSDAIFAREIAEMFCWSKL